MNRKYVAWMECKPAGVSFTLKFDSKSDGNQYARKIGADIIEWRRGN